MTTHPHEGSGGGPFFDPTTKSAIIESGNLPPAFPGGIAKSGIAEYRTAAIKQLTFGFPKEPPQAPNANHAALHHDCPATVLRYAVRFLRMTLVAIARQERPDFPFRKMEPVPEWDDVECQRK